MLFQQMHDATIAMYCSRVRLADQGRIILWHTDACFSTCLVFDIGDPELGHASASMALLKLFDIKLLSLRDELFQCI